MSKRIIVNLSSPPDRTVIRDGKMFYEPIAGGDEVEEILNLAANPEPFTRSSQAVDFALPHNQNYGRGTGIEKSKFDQLVAGLRTQTTRKDNFTNRALNRSGGRIGNPDVRPLRVVTYDNPDLNEGRGQILEITGVSTLGEKYPSLTGFDWNQVGLSESSFTPEQIAEIEAYASAEGAVRPDGTIVTRYTGDTLGDRRNFIVEGDKRLTTSNWKPFSSNTRVIQFTPVGKPFNLYQAPLEIREKIRLRQLVDDENLTDEITPDGSRVHASNQLIDGVVEDREGNRTLYTALKGKALEDINLVDGRGRFTSGGEYQGGVKYPGVDIPTNPLKVVLPGDGDNFKAALNYPMDGVPGRVITPIRVGGVRYQLGFADNNPETMEFYELVRRYAKGDFNSEDLPDFILNSPSMSIPTDGRGKPFHGGNRGSMNYLAAALGQRVNFNQQLREAAQGNPYFKDFSQSTLFPRNQMETLGETVADIDRIQKANLSASENPIDLLQGHANFYLQDEIDDPRVDYEPAMSSEAREVLSDNPNFGKTITTGNIPLVDNLFRQELGEARPNSGIGVKGFTLDNRGFFTDNFGGFEIKGTDESGNTIRTFVQKPLVKTNSLGFPLNPLDAVITSFPSANNWLVAGNQYPLARTIAKVNNNLDFTPIEPTMAGLDLSRMTPAEIYEINRVLGLVTDEPLATELAPLTDPRVMPEGEVSGRPLTDGELLNRKEEIAKGKNNRVYRWSPQLGESEPSPYSMTLDEVLESASESKVESIGQLEGEGYNPENQDLSIFDIPDNVYILDSETGTPMQLSVTGAGAKRTRVPSFTSQLRGAVIDPKTGGMTFTNRANIVGVNPPEEIPADADEIVQGMGYENYAQYLNENRFLHESQKKARLAVDPEKLFIPDRNYDFNDPTIQDAAFVPFTQTIRESDGSLKLDYLFSPTRYGTEVAPEKASMYPREENTITVLDDLLGRTYIEFNGKKYPVHPQPNYGYDREIGKEKVDPTTDIPFGEGLTPTIEDAIRQGKRKITMLRSELGLRKARRPARVEGDFPTPDRGMERPKGRAIASPVSSPDGDTIVYREHFPNTNTGDFNPNRFDFISPERVMPDDEAVAPFSFYDDVIPVARLDDTTLEDLIAHYENEIARATVARDKVFGLQEVDPIDLQIRSVVTPVADRDSFQSVARPSVDLTPEEVEEIQRPGRERAISTLSALLEEIKKTRTAPRTPLPAPVLATPRDPLPRPVTLDSILESDPVIEVPAVATPDRLVVADKETPYNLRSWGREPVREIGFNSLANRQRNRIDALSALLQEIEGSYAPVIDVPAVEIPEVASPPTAPIPATTVSRPPIYFPPIEGRNEGDLLNSLLAGEGIESSVSIPNTPEVPSTPNTLDELFNQPVTPNPNPTVTIPNPNPERNLNTPSSPSSPSSSPASPNTLIDNPNGLVRLPDGRVLPRWMIALGLGGVALGGLAIGRELSRGDNRDDRANRVRDWYGY